MQQDALQFKHSRVIRSKGRFPIKLINGGTENVHEPEQRFVLHVIGVLHA